MSETNNQQAAVEAAEESKAVTVEMTAQEFQQWERNVQLGVTDTLPDGRKISDVHKELTELQIAQDKARSAAGEERAATFDDATAVPNEVKPDTVMNVVIQPNGVVSASPKVEAEAASQNAEDSDHEVENDLPTDYPARKALLAAGYTSLEAVAKFNLEELVTIPGIKQASAEKILAYGKSGD